MQALVAWLAIWLVPAVVIADDVGVGSLHAKADLAAVVPDAVLLLNSPETIEPFLTEVDQSPPNWKAVFGAEGEFDDERLFALNRERNERRTSRGPFPLMFVWPGELSRYDGEAGGYRVAVGPKVIATSWGRVRFKPANLPGHLIAVPSMQVAQDIRQRSTGGQTIEVDVLMIGRLIEGESVIYDMVHDEEGEGLIMPVVEVERILYVAKETNEF